MKIRMVFRVLCKPRRVYNSLLISFLCLIIFIVIYKKVFLTNKPVYIQHFTMITEDIIENSTAEYKKKDIDEEETLKYILLWTPTITPFNTIRKRGRVPFVSNDCPYTNCFLTHRKSYFFDPTRFDAIVFSIAALKNLQDLPSIRSPKQKFVAASTEPAQKHPVINPIFDGYFNWTWTYRLDSDILWRKFRICDFNKKEIGPKKHMKWQNWLAKDSRDHELENFLSCKKKTVVWIKNSCEVNKYNSIQLQYIMELEIELVNNGLSLVTYSNCSGYNSCGNMAQCIDLIQHNFYFYLAFEDYIDEDYVSEIVLLAFESYAIPVVFGGADYSRFLPPGSYVDARKLSPKEVAQEIDNCMSDYYVFIEHFKWVFHYQYLPTNIESEVCNICTALNNERMVNNFTAHKSFRKMWNGEDSVQFSDFIFKAFEDDDALKDMLKNGSYSDIRKAIMKKHLPDPRDSVFVFDMENLSITSTEESQFMPYEFTSSDVI